ncbi:hypothetical protein ABPG72_013395 [Tetrahymena utriculariae]
MNIYNFNLISYLLVISFCRIQAQIQYIQSDRAQILYVNAITKTVQNNDIETNTFQFAKPFKNIPKVILSVQSFNFGYGSSKQQYKLNLKNTDLNSVTVEVSSLDNSVILDLIIGILAVDYPCVNVFKNTINQNKPTAQHTIQYKIQTYAVFFISFLAESSSSLQFDLNNTQANDNTINIQAINLAAVVSIDYNLIVFYCDNTNFIDSPFYEYQINRFQNEMSKSTKVKTNLQTPSTGFYGINSMSLSNFVQTYSIFFKPTNANLPINNGYYDFSTQIVKANNYTTQSVSYLLSQNFDLLKLVCPQNQYFYNKNCIQPTQEGMYCQNNPNICYNCDSNCKTCGTSATNCLSCQQNKYLFENKCYDIQQDGTYCISKVCYRCSKQCKQCKNNQDFCTQCHDFEYLFNNNCQTQKPNLAYCKMRKDKVI